MQKVIRILQLRIFGDEGDGSTSSQEVSHASPFPLPAGERARRTAVTSGLTCSVPFTRSGPVGLLVRTLVASSRWYSPARRLTWDVSPLCSERISLYTASGRNTSSRPSAVILSVKDIPSSRYLCRLVPSELPAQKGPHMVCCPRRWRGITARGDRTVSRRVFRKSSARCCCPPRQRRRYTTGSGWNAGNVRGACRCTRRRTGRRTPTA